MYLARENVPEAFKLLLFINIAFYMIRCLMYSVASSFLISQGETVNLSENKVSSRRKVI